MDLKVFIYLLLLFPLVSLAQDDSPSIKYLDEPIQQELFDENEWVEAKKGIFYTEKSEEAEREKKRREKKKKKGKGDDSDDEDRSISIPKAMSPMASGIFYFLLIIAGIAIVAIIIAAFLGSGGMFKRNRKVDSTPLNFDIDQVEEKLIESDLDRMIRLAEEAKNFPMALRLQYLAGVKALATGSHIKWKKAKTNRRYLREIKNPKLKTQFKQNTLVYERIWYGGNEITEGIYEELKPIFKDFTNVVGKTTATEAITN